MAQIDVQIIEAPAGYYMAGYRDEFTQTVDFLPRVGDFVNIGTAFRFEVIRVTHDWSSSATVPLITLRFLG